ncbi:MAG: hypothetical protein QNJ68_03485 [Microcoleaceae cyanobacterium MO_207.B10]|nr:hypothetical protein [Microcoleaceae cyanobacterium MO_207.B10]
MKPRQSPDNPMGFEFPYEELELPEWARACTATWENYVLEPGNHIRADFDDFECGLFRDAHAYIQEGMKLGAMRYKRLYEEKKVYSFKDYCDRFYIKSYHRCLETILAAQIGWELLCNGFQQVPSNVSQAIALTQTFFKDSFGQPDIIRSWEWVLEYSEATGKKITAGLINFLVNPQRKDEKVKIQVSKKKWEEFKRKAKELNRDPESVLEDFMNSYVGGEEDSSPESEDSEPSENTRVEPVNREAEVVWTDDLNLLLKENSVKNQKHYDTSPDS